VRDFLKFQETAAGGITAIRHLPFPVIAAVRGGAVGGGLALALAADIRLAAPTAKFSAAFVRVGLSMGELGVSFTLSRLVGPGRAAEIGYTGRVVGAEEAVRIGLANRIVPSERLYDEALAMATVIAAHPPGGVRLSKRAIQRNQEITSYAAALELENRGQALLTGPGTHDPR
jgi:enoyl-CoA hydratase/carnithine racemase